MKLLPSLAFMLFVLCTSSSFGRTADSLSAKHAMHHFDVLIGNYSGQPIMNHASNPSMAIYTPPGQLSYNNVQFISGPFGQWGGVFAHPRFTGLYSGSFGFNYHADLSRRFGFRTGLNYLFYRYRAHGTFESSIDHLPPYLNSTQTYSRQVLTSMLHIPLQMLVYKDLKKGRLVFSAGPDIYLPLYISGTESVYTPSTPTFVPDYSVATMRLNTTLSTTNVLRGGSMGLSVSLGYEKQLSKNVAISVMPDFHLQNLLPFYIPGNAKDLYQNYTFNTTTGLSVYFSFSRTTPKS